MTGRWGRLVRRLDPLVHAPRLPLLAAAMAGLLCLPALAVGWQADDWMHQALVRQIEPLEHQRSRVAEFFAFMDGDPRRNAMLRERGILPWWVPLNLRARLWRPLTALTHMADHALAPGSPVFAHLHSLAWGMLLVALAALFFRRLMGLGWASGLAALIYAVDEARGVPMGWLANRNALITGCAALGVLLLHHRWRCHGWTPGAVLGPVVLALGLLAGEAALAAAAYLLAYALFLDRGSLLWRLLRLWPHALVVVAWRAVYSALGYGATGSGLYLDPLSTPDLYLLGLLKRVPALLADQLLNFPSIITSFAPHQLALPLTVALVLALLLLGRALLRVLRDSKLARFWATGMLLSTLPVAATFPWSRLLTLVGLGGAGLVALFLARCLGFTAAPGLPAPVAPGPRRWAALLVCLHLLLAPLCLPGQTYGIKLMGITMMGACERAAPSGPQVKGQTVVYVNSNDLCVSYVPFIRAVKGAPAPRRVRLLASALYDLEFTGVDRHTMDLRVVGGMQSNPADSLLRGPQDPLPVGTKVELSDVSFEVLGWNERQLVNHVRLRFRLPLRHPDLVWLCTREVQASVFVPPRPGEVVRLRKAF